MPAHDVPAQFESPPAIQNEIQVQGGRNWDMSRAARETPIVALPDPEPQRIAPSRAELLAAAGPRYRSEDGVPSGSPLATISFDAESVVLDREDQAILRDLGKRGALLLVGHADRAESAPLRLSEGRIAATRAFLRDRGQTIGHSIALGDTRPDPRPTADPVRNRIVAVYLDPNPPKVKPRKPKPKPAPPVTKPAADCDCSNEASPKPSAAAPAPTAPVTAPTAAAPTPPAATSTPSVPSAAVATPKAPPAPTTGAAAPSARQSAASTTGSTLAPPSASTSAPPGPPKR